MGAFLTYGISMLLDQLIEEQTMNGGEGEEEGKGEEEEEEERRTSRRLSFSSSSSPNESMASSVSETGYLPEIPGVKPGKAAFIRYLRDVQSLFEAMADLRDPIEKETIQELEWEERELYAYDTPSDSQQVATEQDPFDKLSVELDNALSHLSEKQSVYFLKLLHGKHLVRQLLEKKANVSPKKKKKKKKKDEDTDYPLSTLSTLSFGLTFEEATDGTNRSAWVSEEGKNQFKLAGSMSLQYDQMIFFSTKKL